MSHPYYITLSLFCQVVFEKILKSKSGEVFLGMMLGIVEIVAVLTISLGAITIQNGSGTVSQAKYASFVQQFGEFSDQLIIADRQFLRFPV